MWYTAITLRAVQCWCVIYTSDVLCVILCAISRFFDDCHTKIGLFQKKSCDSFNVNFFSHFQSFDWMVDSNYNFLGLKLSGLWVKIIIVKRLSKIINVNRLNIPSTAAESLKVLEKRPETAVNFVFFCVIFGNFSDF